jgi:hypothetical protein
MAEEISKNELKPRIDTLKKWAADNKWLMIGKGAGMEGRIYHYLTPSGNFITVQYNIAGDILGIGGKAAM